MKKKIYSNSFASRLTAEQRDELFAALKDGLSYSEAAAKIRHWMKTNDEAGLNGARPGREIQLTQATTIAKWYHTTAIEHRYAAAQEVDRVARAQCPPDYEEQTRRALGQARLLAILEGLRPADIALLERNEIAREKLALDREKLARYAHLQRIDLLIDQAKFLLARSQAGEKSADLQRQIDLTLEEIERLKHGED